jgi:putative Ca2+/H+ antiporter (TMEM165/GDT1 family)
MIPLLLTTYGAVFAAEIVGDKLLYTTGVLAARYRSGPIMVGMAMAFMLKMGVAVMVGEALRKLPPILVASLTAASFIGVAITLWRKPEYPDRAKKKDHSAPKAAMVSFAAIFFSEWGDVGQITAATMAASPLAAQFTASMGTRWSGPLVVWIGAVSAMVTKGILAASLGAGVRRWIQERVAPQVVRYVAVILLVILGSLSVLEAFGIVD